jgi:O-antigen ligase
MSSSYLRAPASSTPKWIPFAVAVFGWGTVASPLLVSANLPIDLFSLATIAMVAGLARSMTLHAPPLPAPQKLRGLFLLALLLVPAGFFAPSTPYGMTKMLVAALVFPLALLAPPFMIRTDRDAVFLAVGLLGISAIAVASTLPHALTEGTSRVGVAGVGGAIGSGRSAGLLLVGIVGFLLSQRHRWYVVVALTVLGSMASIVLLRSETRAALVGAVAVVAIMLLRRFRFSRRDMMHPLSRAVSRDGLAIMTATIGVALAFLAARFTPMEAIPGRITRPWSEDVARRVYFRVAWESGIDSPMGNGWGSFPQFLGRTGEAYPHNILLELWVEAGWLPALVLAVLLVIAIRRTFTSPARVSSVLLPLLLFATVNAMLSEDVIGNRLLLVLMAVSITTPGAPAIRPYRADLPRSQQTPLSDDLRNSVGWQSSAARPQEE